MEYVWTPIIPFNPQNVARVPNDKGGLYRLYDRYMHQIYAGRASGSKYGHLRHRLQSYYQKDVFHGEDGHPTKKALRKEIGYFNWAVVSNKKQRRAMEKKIKTDWLGRPLRHNHN